MLKLRLVEQVEEEDHGQADHQPHAQVLVKCVQNLALTTNQSDGRWYHRLHCFGNLNV